MITLALTGDVMLGRGVAAVLDDHMRPEAPGDVMPFWTQLTYASSTWSALSRITSGRGPARPKSSISGPSPLP